MKLLIVTQKVDSKDPILGFFHRWIEEFAKHYDHVVVIGQFVGEHHLSQNVEVHSLGKENGASRLRQIFRFWKLQKGLKDRYDTVLVHMTPIWVVLGARFWKKESVPVYLWYEARGGGWALPRAVRSVKAIFGATPYGLPIDSAKHHVVGHGIDTDMFTPLGSERDPHAVVAVGRMTAVKRYDLILRAFSALSDAMRLRIYGVTITDADQATLREFSSLCDELHLSDRVEGPQSIEHAQLPAVLRQSTLLLHAAEGGLDKAILEAMASGCLVATCSAAAKGVLPDECVASPDTLGEVASALLSLSSEKQEALRSTLRDIVVAQHSLSTLIERLYSSMDATTS